MSIIASYRNMADRHMDDMETGTTERRVPLTANQHILHLLLTVFTAGLWAPVWFVRAWHGNPAPTI